MSSIETDSSAPDLISVVMPCFNAAAYVEEAISSVLRQSHKNTEIIVVDDGSSDKSCEIIARLATAHPHRIMLKHQDHLGPYPARNLGLRAVRGNYVAFLDADDWWRDDCLEKLFTVLQYQNADLAYCGWQNVGSQIHDPKPYIPPAYEEQDPVAAFLKSCPWPIHAALVRRTVIEAVEGFSVRCFSSMDYDLWLRILGHTRNIARAPEVLAFYRWHGSGQISANKWSQVLDAVQVRHDFVTRFPHLTTHLSAEVLYELVDGQLMKEAYRAYWKRDMINSQKLFRVALARHAWKLSDLKYILPALLPARLFQGLIATTDRSHQQGVR